SASPSGFGGQSAESSQARARSLSRASVHSAGNGNCPRRSRGEGCFEFRSPVGEPKFEHVSFLESERRPQTRHFFKIARGTDSLPTEFEKFYWYLAPGLANAV